MFPRSARKVSNVAVAQMTQQHTFANATVLSSFSHKSKIGAIHTKKTQQYKAPSSPTTKPSSRWFTSVATAMPAMPAMSLPSLPVPAMALPSLSDLSPRRMTERLGQFVGNASMANQNSRVMQRVWEKRQKRLYKATNAVMEVFRSKSLQFESAEIYVRTAGMFDDAEDNGQREVHIALRGIAHTVVVLRSNEGTYLLDRVVEGIRLTELSVDASTGEVEECAKFKPNEMLRLSTHRQLGLSGSRVADWIEVESKKEYNVITNSCVNFSYFFHQHFLRGLKTQQFIDSVRTTLFGTASTVRPQRVHSSEQTEQ